MSMNIPNILYHGTSLDYVEGIENQGLIAVNHDKVFLTADIHVAYEYAMKRVSHPQSNTFQPVICAVYTTELVNRYNHIFDYNDLTQEWTTEFVPNHFILQIAVESEDELQEVAEYANNSCYSVRSVS